jgi:outer membrane lipoprotein
MRRRILSTAFPFAVLFALALLIGGCFGPPAPLAGTFAPIAVRQAQESNLIGQRVRWGGTIVAVTPGKHDTCLEVLSRPLQRDGRPRYTDASDGRFIACATGFYDPEVYAKGRDVTVVGTLQEPETHKIGNHEYRYPKVAAETVYLWPQREVFPPYYYAPMPDFWYPAWGPWSYGSWDYHPRFWGPWPYP